MMAMTQIAGLAALSLACVLTGCASGEPRPTAAPRREVPLEQRYSLEEVESRAGELRQGMTRADVYMLLGSPAEYGDDAWVYRGGLDGGRELRVTFKDGVYAGGAGPR